MRVIHLTVLAGTLDEARHPLECNILRDLHRNIPLNLSAKYAFLIGIKPIGTGGFQSLGTVIVQVWYLWYKEKKPMDAG